MENFIENVVQKARMGNRIYCPCFHCDNKSLLPVRKVKGHLYFNDINSSYRRWIWHREGASLSALVNFNSATMNVGIDDNDDDVVSMVNVIEDELVDRHEQFERLLGDTEKPFYFGCTNNFIKLSVIVCSYNLMAGNG